MADSSTAPAGASDNPVCCGERDWGAAGKPLQPGCALCGKSPSYWKLPENRGDGKPFVERPPTY
jgi:hypothetical protein